MLNINIRQITKIEITPEIADNTIPTTGITFLDCFTSAIIPNIIDSIPNNTDGKINTDDIIAQIPNIKDAIPKPCVLEIILLFSI